MLNGLAGRDRRLKKSAAPASSDIQHFTDGLTFMSLSLDAAKALLDGGIDAAAALSTVLNQVLLHSPEEIRAGLKNSFGAAMVSVLTATVDVAL